MSAVDEIKSRLDIVDIVSETVKLRRSGKSYTGFCPFHANTRTPAFVVFPDSGTWRCFGECNEGGDIFKYVMKKEGWDFPTALRNLAKRAGVELEPLTPQRKEAEERYEKLRALLEDAVTYFRHQLLQTRAGNEALEFLKRRGLNNETIEQFGLGYAPDGYQNLIDHFSARGVTQQELVEAGLVSERQEGGIYDRFRHRVMFPIRDSAGRMAGFGARILRPDDVPKFLNSPQTAVFDKGRLLYGLDLARKAIRAKDQVVIVEGYLDVILLHQAGYTNTVSPMGTALTEDQMRMLKKMTRRVVLALDADSAGEKATLRGLEIARQAMDHSPEIDPLRYNPRGLIQYEGRLQADIRITTLPEGKDPDEVVLADPASWGRILEEAKPVVIHVMETLAAGKDLDDPKTKSEIAAQVLRLIEDVPDAVERDAYRQRLARMIKVDERALVVSRPGPMRPARRENPAPRPSVRAQPAARAEVRPDRALESHCLTLLLKDPEAVYAADRALLAGGLVRLDWHDFVHTDHQLLYRLLQAALEQDAQEPQEYLAQAVPADLQPLFDALISAGKQLKQTQEKLQEDLVRTVIKMRLEQVNEGIRQLRFLQEGLEEQSESGENILQEQVVQYTRARGRLEKALARPLQFD